MSWAGENVRRVFACTSLVLVMCCPRLGEARTLSPEGGFNALVQLERSTLDMPDTQRTKALGTLYREAFTAAFEQATLGQRNDDDLRYLFRSADLVAFYTASPETVGDMVAAFVEMQQRGIAKPLDYQRMYQAFIGARMLSAASNFFASHHAMGLDALPTVREVPGIEPGAPTEWVVSPEAQELTREPSVWLGSARILVIGHPLCHFTQNAVRDIFADPQLGTLFAEHAHWLAPQDRQLKVGVFQQWNRDHPDAPMSIAYKASEWPLVDGWATPTFYFLRDGAVVTKVVGWPAAGNRDELRDALRRIGLLTRDGPGD